MTRGRGRPKKMVSLLPVCQAKIHTPSNKEDQAESNSHMNEADDTQIESHEKERDDERGIEKTTETQQIKWWRLENYGLTF
ncbi:unnamed protein product [Lathyrus sativus]|nr:unnamed protein product [Lathyrus sativus]